MRYPFEVNLHGDAQATLAALLPMLRRKTDGSWRETVEKNTARWWQVMDVLLTADSGSVCGSKWLVKVSGHKTTVCGSPGRGTGRS